MYGQTCGCKEGETCTNCGSCAGSNGLTIIDVGEVTQNQQALKVGDVLIGYRGDSQELCDHIRKDFQYIGNGLCRNKKKRVDIYINFSETNTYYGVSTVLGYRYFNLVKA